MIRNAIYLSTHHQSYDRNAHTPSEDSCVLGAVRPSLRAVPGAGEALSDPAKENARNKWAELNKEFEALKKKVEDPNARKSLDYKAWLEIKDKLIDLKLEGLGDIPGPYGRKLVDWYMNLWEVDFLIEELDDEFQVDEKSEQVWKDILNHVLEAKKAKERLEKFVE